MRRSQFYGMGSPLVAAIVCSALVATDGREVRAQLRSGLVGNPQIAPLGLETYWSTFVRVDPSRGRLATLNLNHGILLAQTDQGVVQGIDPETGRTLWITSVGSPNYQTTSAAANAKYAAVANGSTLYLLDRKSGAVAWEQRLIGSPSAGPGLSDERVYIPLDSGVVESFLVERGEGGDALRNSVSKRYSGKGGAEFPPLVVGKRANWVVRDGYVYSREDTFENIVQFRFKLDDRISAPPAVMLPYLFVASRRGTLYGLDGETGGQAWNFSFNNTVSHPPITIDGALFFINESGEMVRLDPRFGKQLWYTRGVQRFVAAGAGRLYLFDIYGRLTARDAATGLLQGEATISEFNLPCYNTETDRLYLATTSGVVQCLRQTQLVQAEKHSPGSAIPPPAPPGAAPTVDPNAPAPPTPAAGANPFGM